MDTSQIKIKMADTEQPEPTNKPKKRPKVGRKCDQNKKQRLQGHQTGEDCKCVRLKCWSNTTEAERNYVIEKFNQIETKNEQDAFLSSLIKVKIVRRRRPRQQLNGKSDEENAKLHDHSYEYFVKVCSDGALARNVQVCSIAFCAIFGIGMKRVERIRKSLAETGRSIWVLSLSSGLCNWVVIS